MSSEKLFGIGSIVKLCGGNSKATKHKVIDVNWYETDNSFLRRSCWKYTLSEVGNPEKIYLTMNGSWKMWSTLCPYEYYVEGMRGKTVCDVEFDEDALTLQFTDGTTYKFGADYGQSSGYLIFGDNV